MPQNDVLFVNSVRCVEQDVCLPLRRDAKLAVQQLLEVQGYGSDVSELSVSQGEKAIYSCPICQKSFRVQSYINQHMKTHTGRPCSLS